MDANSRPVHTKTTLSYIGLNAAQSGVAMCGFAFPVCLASAFLCKLHLSFQIALSMLLAVASIRLRVSLLLRCLERRQQERYPFAFSRV